MVTRAASVDRHTAMGATVVAGGATFRLWAPEAQQVFVLHGASLKAAAELSFVPSLEQAMLPLGDGTWAAFVPAAGDGTAYRFWVAGLGSSGFKRDPRARELGTQPPYPECDCIVRDPSSYPWHDAGYVAPAFADLVVYQLHVGTWYGVDAQGRDKRRSVAKFLDLLDRIDHLVRLGVNAVQLLPIQEFASETSRGYNGLDLYSPETDYHVVEPGKLAPYLQRVNALLLARGQATLMQGDLRPGPNQLKCVIDLLHLHGIGVFFDLVFNHAGPGFNDQSLKFLDRQQEGDDNRSLYFTEQEWVGGNVFAYWKQPVRQFLIDNVKQCFEEFHADGIRYDEVTVIERHGGSTFCQDLTATARAAKPQAIQIAEYWADDRAAALRPPPGGLGFDAAWGDRLRDGIRSAVAQASGGAHAFVDMVALASAFDTPEGFGAGWRVVNCLENHDVVYDGNSPRLPVLADGPNPHGWYARSRARVATGLLMAARGIPQLFMGQEFLEAKPWSDDVTWHAPLLIDWDALAADKTLQDHLQFHRDLIALRRRLAPLRGEGLHVSTGNGVDRVIAVHRWADAADPSRPSQALLVANLQEFNRYAYRIGFPAGGPWREVFNSDFYDDLPNLKVAGNAGATWADDRVAWDGMPASAAITLPANGFVVFVR